MTAKEMDARLVEIERELNELQARVDLDAFCYRCSHIRIKAKEHVEYGFVCRREYADCPSGFWPDEKCPRAGEYSAVSERIAGLISEHEQISLAYMEA